MEFGSINWGSGHFWVNIVDTNLRVVTISFKRSKNTEPWSAPGKGLFASCDVTHFIVEDTIPLEDACREMICSIYCVIVRAESARSNFLIAVLRRSSDDCTKIST